MVCCGCDRSHSWRTAVDRFGVHGPRRLGDGIAAAVEVVTAGKGAGGAEGEGVVAGAAEEVFDAGESIGQQNTDAANVASTDIILPIAVIPVNGIDACGLL